MPRSGAVEDHAAVGENLRCRRRQDPLHVAGVRVGDHLQAHLPAASSTKPAPKPHPGQPPHPTPMLTPSYGTPSPYHSPARN
ncbi:hypothetical protein OsJ_24267 [Oryza sativa Japonica Group]|uniref:Uncharacterized protein n=1 Tax=Oryza sativa subsp. japonica TaxID=39947 RepID=B9FX91_ORYSJ|nr:hypothetical protein OsJ_24267 [Oryza sativa Japonica Group]